MKRLFQLINRNIEGTTLHAQSHSKNSKFSIITISRELGSGGKPIAYLLAKKLGSPWQVFHKDIVEEIAHETALENEVVERFDEHHTSAVNSLIQSIFGKQILTMNAYFKHLLHVLASIGTRGNAIIIGRGANFLFPNALKVRIISSMEDRIQSMVKYEHITAKEAKKQIEKSDEDRDTYIRELFQHDARKAHHYDVVIRTGKEIDVEAAVDAILSLTKKRAT